MCDMFIPDIANIIYEYAKCCYCAHVKSRIISHVNGVYECRFSSDKLMRVCHNKKTNQWSFMIIHEFGQEYIEAQASGSIDTIVYYMVHSEICELNEDANYNISQESHTEMKHKIQPEIVYLLRGFDIKFKHVDHDGFDYICLCGCYHGYNLRDSYIDL